MSLRFLTEHDREVLQGLIRKEMLSLRNSRYEHNNVTQEYAPEIYIAKVPTGGIPARSIDTPGHTTCDIYKRDDASGDLIAIAYPDASKLQEEVYNLGTSAISASVGYVKVTRDKFGVWIADTLGSSKSLVVFELTSTLSPGTAPYTANAVICSLITIGGYQVYDSTGGAAITVADWSFGKLWSGAAGARGLGSLRADGAYDIVFLDMIDGLFEFTVHSDRPSGYSFISVDATGSYQQGGLGVTTNPFNVQDPQYLFPRALTGGKGVGFYDYFTQTYRVISCQQQCITATALINQTGGLTDLGAVTIDNFVATSPSPFNLVPATAPTTAYNPRQHYGKDNDAVWLQWNENTGHWEVTDVIRKVHNVLTDLRQNTANTWFEAEQVAQVALEYHEDPGYANKIAIGACP